MDIIDKRKVLTPEQFIPLFLASMASGNFGDTVCDDDYFQVKLEDNYGMYARNVATSNEMLYYRKIIDFSYLALRGEERKKYIKRYLDAVDQFLLVNNKIAKHNFKDDTNLIEFTGKELNEIFEKYSSNEKEAMLSFTVNLKRNVEEEKIKEKKYILRQYE